MKDKPTCEHCDDTGYIGSPFEIGHYPCTDCNIFWDRVRKPVQEITENRR
ncbi:MAG: hypothetical protein K0Q81_1911 [Paenibacillus sp.]|jgi:hypothetical protein|nr:hypothetical protein [Paenibacillus sp.]